MTNAPIRVVDKPGWAWPMLAKKAHYFSTSGRSYCGKWLFTGELQESQSMSGQAGPEDCVACWRKASGRAGETGQ